MHRTILSVCFILCLIPAAPTRAQETTPTRFTASLTPEAILRVTEATADWQLKSLRSMPDSQLTQWTQGTCHIGLMALSAVSTNPDYPAALWSIADRTGWRLGRNPVHADDQCISQLYLELLGRRPDPDRLSLVRRQLDAARDASSTDSWSWCDALFMAPPAWARLYQATGDASYLEFLDRLWADTTDKLYDADERLYARDRSKIPRREANGAKVFWCRGNGWVMAALARTIPLLPDDHPSRKTYLAIFREMAGRIAGLQQADGMWRSSLLDPGSYPLPESSGSGLFAFALAWGINQGFLDRATYRPVVERAWAGLVDCVGADGRLGYVQPIGGGPARFSPEDTQTYGVGAFLLAGSEILRLSRDGSGSSR